MKISQSCLQSRAIIEEIAFTEIQNSPVTCRVLQISHQACCCNPARPFKRDLRRFQAQGMPIH